MTLFLYPRLCSANCGRYILLTDPEKLVVVEPNPLKPGELTFRHAACRVVPIVQSVRKTTTAPAITTQGLSGLGFSALQVAKLPGVTFQALNIQLSDLRWILPFKDRPDELTVKVLQPLANIGMTYQNVLTLANAASWETLPPLIQQHFKQAHWRVLKAPEGMFPVT